MSTENNTAVVTQAEGAFLDELVALAFFFPEGYPPFGMYGVTVHEGACLVFRDGIGEFEFSPCSNDEHAQRVFRALEVELDLANIQERINTLRQFVRDIRGEVVDLDLTLPMERFKMDGNTATLIPKEEMNNG